MEEVRINDAEQVKYMLAPDGRLDDMPSYRKVSGNGTFEADADGMGVQLISDTLGVNEAQADTEYEVSAMAGGMPLTLQLILHVDNDVPPSPPAMSLGGSFGRPTPKP